MVDQDDTKEKRLFCEIGKTVFFCYDKGKVTMYSYGQRSMCADLLNQLQGKNRQLWQFMIAA